MAPTPRQMKKAGIKAGTFMAWSLASAPCCKTGRSLSGHSVAWYRKQATHNGTRIQQKTGGEKEKSAITDSGRFREPSGSCTRRSRSARGTSHQWFMYRKKKGTDES